MPANDFTNPGRNREALSLTHDSVPFVMMIVSPKDNAVKSSASAAPAMSANTSGGGLGEELRRAELHRSVSSQSNMKRFLAFSPVLPRECLRGKVAVAGDVCERA